MTRIVGHAFDGNTGITSVTIPNTVTSVVGMAFANCTSLTTVTFEDGGESLELGWAPFGSCTALTTLTLPLNVKSFKMGGQDFSNTAITKVELPKNTTSMGQGAFSGCKSLVEVTLPEGMSCALSSSTFSGCTSLKEITIPYGITSIGGSAFNGCISLSKVTIGTNTSGATAVTSIGSNAFANCRALTSIAIPEGVTSLGQEIFYNCKTLASLTLPSTLTTIGDMPFKEDPALSSITVASANTHFVVSDGALYGLTDGVKTKLIWCLTNQTGEFVVPSTVTEIAAQSFSGAKKVTSAYIPKSVTYIGNYAFNNSAVITFNMEGSKPPAVGDGFSRSNVTVKVPYGAVDTYKESWPTTYNFVYDELPGFQAGNNVKEILSVSYSQTTSGKTTIGQAIVTLTPTTTYAYVLDGVNLTTDTMTSRTATATEAQDGVITVTVTDVEKGVLYTVNLKAKATFTSADATLGTVAANWTATDKATVAISPAAGYQLVSATKNSGKYTVTTGATSVSVTGIKSADAYVFTFNDVAKSATFKSANETKGTVSVSTYKGATATVAISPATGYQLVSATKNGSAYTVATAATTVNVSDIKNADAYIFTFDDIAKSATFTAGDNGTVTVDSYAGASATVTISPADGYKFLAATKNNEAITLTPSASGKATLTGIKNADAYHFTFVDLSTGATFTAGDHGKVSASLKGSTATVTITADEGYVFSGATKDGKAITVSPDASGKATITGVGSTDVYFFSFTDVARLATFTQPENGSIDVAYSGSSASVTVTPAEGYVFNVVSKNGTEQTLTPDENGVITISGITKGDVYTFVFADVASRATFVAGANGSISGKTFSGTTAYVTVTPADGYEYSSTSCDKSAAYTAEENNGTVTISGVVSGATYTISFTDVARGATFTQPENGTISVAYSGSTASVTVTPAEGYVFSVVKKNGTELTLTPDENGVVTISGVAKGDEYTFAFVDVASRATYTAGENCISVNATYKGTTAYVAATPQTGYILRTILKNGGEWATGLSDNSNQIPNVAATDVYVFNCIDIAKTVSFADTENGSIVDDSFTYNGAEISFIVSPADGYEFDDVTTSDGDVVEYSVSAQDGMITIFTTTPMTTYVVTFKEAQAKGIVSPADSDVTVEAIFDLAGHKVSQMGRGVFFIRYSNGTVKKVLRK